VERCSRGYGCGFEGGLAAVNAHEMECDAAKEFYDEAGYCKQVVIG
jgi:hypothetical protein